MTGRAARLLNQPGSRACALSTIPGRLQRGHGCQDLGTGVAGIWAKWQTSHQPVVGAESEPKGVTSSWQNVGQGSFCPRPPDPMPSTRAGALHGLNLGSLGDLLRDRSQAGPAAGPGPLGTAHGLRPPSAENHVCASYHATEPVLCGRPTCRRALGSPFCPKPAWPNATAAAAPPDAPTTGARRPRESGQTSHLEQLWSSHGPPLNAHHGPPTSPLRSRAVTGQRERGTCFGVRRPWLC